MHRFKPGDDVTRVFGGLKMPLKVTACFENTLVCGPWEFDLDTGMEIDDMLGWGPTFGRSGSYIKEIVEAIK